MKSYDAIIVGSGPNALVNAAYLTKAGWSVLILEKKDRPGGGLRTEALTLPGFTHDIYAGYLILFALSQANVDFGADLQARGLQMIGTQRPAGVSMPGGKAAVIATDMEANIAEAERLSPGDGAGWMQMIQTIGQYAPQVFSLLKMNLTSPEAANLIEQLMTIDGKYPAAFTSDFLVSARDVLTSLYKSETWQGILAPWVLHSGHGPEDANSGFWTHIFALGLQSAGQFVAVGGTEMLAKSLVKLIEDQGGEFQCDTTVSKIIVENGKAVGVRTESGEEYRASRAVIATANPDQLYLKLLADEETVPAIVKQQASKFRYGHSVLHIHLALNESLQWHDDRLNDVVYTHITDGIDGVSKNYNETTRHLLPSEPVIGVGSPTILDPSRAPEGKSIAVLQVLDIPYQFKGDAAGEIKTIGDGTWTDDIKNRYADRVIDLASQHIPNLKDAILAQSILSPLDVEKGNVNWKYGDPYSGAHDIAQSYLLRPISSQPSYQTGVPNLYVIGAATHPGLGIGGASGYIVAQDLLNETKSSKQGKK
ncbi:phytoene desaturase family protein [Phormidesmis sp. 146-35]